MPKFVFACLVAINIGLLAFQLGWLDALLPTGREPQRMRNQINADKLNLLSPRPAAPASEPTQPAPAPAAEPDSKVSAAAPESPVSAPPAALPVVHTPAAAASTEPDLPARAASAAATHACVEIGNLTPADARRFETRLATLTLPSDPIRRETREESSHMVWIPPMPGGKPAAERKVAELRTLGVQDYYLLQEDMPQRNGISLGVFTTEAAAKARLAQLGRQGVRSARLIEHRIPLVRAAYQIAVADEATREALQRISSEFPRHSAAACAA